MERRLLLSTVAVALVLGTAAASAQTPRPLEHNQNAPQATPSQTAPRANPQSGAAAPNAPMPPGAAEHAGATERAECPAAGAARHHRAGCSAAAAKPAECRQPGAAARGRPGPAAAGRRSRECPPRVRRKARLRRSPAWRRATRPARNDANAQQNANPNTNVNANAGAQGVITLNEQQNTRVAQAVRQANVRPLANVSFSIAVGTTIPADIQLNVLPLELVEVVPQYRGYSFVVVEQEALIIDPGTRAIVAVVPFEARQTTGANQAAPPARAGASRRPRRARARSSTSPATSARSSAGRRSVTTRPTRTSASSSRRSARRPAPDLASRAWATACPMVRSSKAGLSRSIAARRRCGRSAITRASATFR